MVILDTNLDNLLHRGKVRDTYDLGNGYLLMVVTDRISAFDIVLPNGIPEKGKILARISEFWFEKTNHIVVNHFVALADSIGEDFRPSLPSLSKDLAQQSMIVKRAERIDIECIIRGYLAGSAWNEYKAEGTIFGNPAPTGLKEGDAFPNPIFTPTTKSEITHDTNMPIEQVVDMVGEKLAKQLEETSLAIYKFAHDYAKERGIIIADTKMEFGLLNGDLILIDELLTPDSSRFWEGSTYRPGQSQPNYDKQFVRDWLNESGWDHEPPSPKLPEEIVNKTSERYSEAYTKLTGKQLN
jgi:phosphoribosylaminoimidazole-succinocarboxamide synthase